MENRVKEIRNCIRCREPFHRHGGNTKAKYCSRLCACRDRNTKEHQKKAGKLGGDANGARTYRKGIKGYVKKEGKHEHRVVMEKILGRKLKNGEIVHHIDENKHNNHPSNLKLWNQKDHARYHIEKRRKNSTVSSSNRGDRILEKK